MKREATLALALTLVACGDEAVPAPTAAQEVRAYRGSLAVDIRGSAQVGLDLGAGLDVTLALADVDTKGAFDAAAPLAAHGRRDRFPETGSELFSAVFPVAASPGGPCGDQPVTLALSLHQRPPNHRFGGSLTAYCGTKAAGVPVRILRLSGELDPQK